MACAMMRFRHFDGDATLLFLNFLLIAIAGYLAGSIPTSVWVGKRFFDLDVREHGSGNAGATNTFRVLGWKPAAVVLAIDIAKGFLPTLYAPTWWFAQDHVNPLLLQILAGICAVLGHCYTLFAGFRGGKGVGSAAGMMLAIFPNVAPICFLVFALVTAITRYVSLGSLCAAATLPTGLLMMRFALGKPVSQSLLALSILTALFIFYTHRTNIKRLLQGTENRLGGKNAKED